KIYRLYNNCCSETATSVCLFVRNQPSIVGWFSGSLPVMRACVVCRGSCRPGGQRRDAPALVCTSKLDGPALRVPSEMIRSKPFGSVDSHPRCVSSNTKALADRVGQYVAWYQFPEPVDPETFHVTCWQLFEYARGNDPLAQQAAR